MNCLWNSLSWTLSAQSCNSDSGKTVIDVSESFAFMKKREENSGLEPSCVSFHYHLISQAEKNKQKRNIKIRMIFCSWRKSAYPQSEQDMNCSRISLWFLFWLSIRCQNGAEINIYLLYECWLLSSWFTKTDLLLEVL